MTNKNITTNGYFRKKAMLFFVLSLILFIILGSAIVFFVWKMNINTQSENAIVLAESLEVELDADMLQGLNGKLEDVEEENFQKLRNMLISIAEKNTSISSLYIWKYENNEIFWIVDSEPDTGEDYVITGQVYTEATEWDIKPFITGETVLTKPLKDRWGEWISTFVPIKDENGNVLAVYGIDYSKEVWYKDAIVDSIHVGFMILLVFLIINFIYMISLKNIKLKKEEFKYHTTENRIDEILKNINGIIFTCKNDTDFTIDYISPNCENIIGYKINELMVSKKAFYNKILDKSNKNIIIEEWEKSIKNQKSFNKEYEIICKDYSRKWVFEKCKLIEGKENYIEGIILDFTQQKKRKEKLIFFNDYDPLTGIYNRNYFYKSMKDIKITKRIPLSIMVCDINGLQTINDDYGYEKGDNVLKQVTNFIKQCLRSNDIFARTGGDEFSIILPDTDERSANTIKNCIQKMCGFENKFGNYEYTISISVGYCTKKNDEGDLNETLQNAQEYLTKEKLFDKRSSRSSILESIKQSLFERSNETEEHCERLQKLSYLIAKELNFTENEINNLKLAALLHDIGKMGIPDSILSKSGKLNGEEWIKMRKHPEIGYRIAKANKDLLSIAKYILFHHERWDGTGYPKGLKGEEIPLISRIIAIADSFDAMTNDRPYRKALTKEKALFEILANKGKQFDPNLCDIFVKRVMETNII